MAIDLKQLSDHHVYAIADEFSHARYKQPRKSVKKIAEWARHMTGLPFKREDLYRVFWEAKDRGLWRMVPPEDQGLVEEFRQTFGEHESSQRLRPIRVVTPGRPGSIDHIAEVAAQTALREVKRIYAHKLAELAKQRNAAAGEVVGADVEADLDTDPDTDPDADIDVEATDPHVGIDLTVRIGVVSGFAALLFAERFAQVLRGDRTKRPAIVLQAISPPFEPPDQKTAANQTAANRFLEVFGGIRGVSYEMFDASSYVPTEAYNGLMKSPGLRDVFTAKMGMDIVVTSFGSRRCGHSDFTKFMEKYAEEDAAGLTALDAADWCGDAQRRPYSQHGPIMAATKFRPVTLYELEDLVALSRYPSKAVILMAGRCLACGDTREDALLPLLENDKLLIWSHLVVDAVTAERCLAMRTARRASNGG